MIGTCRYLVSVNCTKKEHHNNLKKIMSMMNRISQLVDVNGGKTEARTEPEFGEVDSVLKLSPRKPSFRAATPSFLRYV
jgi:hypothetical protein